MLTQLQRETKNQVRQQAKTTADGLTAGITTDPEPTASVGAGCQPTVHHQRHRRGRAGPTTVLRRSTGAAGPSLPTRAGTRRSMVLHHFHRRPVTGRCLTTALRRDGYCSGARGAIRLCPVRVTRVCTALLLIRSCTRASLFHDAP